MGLLTNNKVAIVTGAGHGVGRAEAIDLARQGARVIVNDIGASPDGRVHGDRSADIVVAQILSDGGSAIADYSDVSDWDSARRLVERAVSHYGDLDILVNNAGIVRAGLILELGESDLDALLGVHVKGTIATSWHAARYWMSRRGSENSPTIINTTSRAAFEPRHKMFGLYGAAKGAVATFTLTAALEWQEYGIRVNAIAPHAFTRMEAFAKKLDFDEQATAATIDPLSPDNIGPVVSWLASDQARHITGRIFFVEGGTVIRYSIWEPAESARREARWEAADLAEDPAFRSLA
jgi:NAD(P)-dependent dehydrogenase (short-subunit alcohol dehydrogenase family)